MCYNGYFVNHCSNEHVQRFEIMSILKQASMKREIVQINRLLRHLRWDFLLVSEFQETSSTPTSLLP
jgi:hypothetical protein